MKSTTQPAVAGDSIKPGVKRSGTPGPATQKDPQPAERATAANTGNTVARSAGWYYLSTITWGSLRFTPGFMLSPAMRARLWIWSPNDCLCKASDDHRAHPLNIDLTAGWLKRSPRHAQVRNPSIAVQVVWQRVRIFSSLGSPQLPSWFCSASKYFVPRIISG